MHYALLVALRTYHLGSSYMYYEEKNFETVYLEHTVDACYFLVHYMYMCNPWLNECKIRV